MRYSRALAVTAVVGLLLIASAASAVANEWVFVGNAGNVADTEVMTCCNNQGNNRGFDSIGTTGYGSVAYSYYISKYEITNAEYAEFLNAKAVSDPLAL